MKRQIPSNQKYKGSHITQKELHRIWWQLHDSLESNSQLWLQATRNKSFCDLLKTNEKYFSQTVNQATANNITTLLNCCRLELFLEKLQNGEAQLKSIEGLSNESGFQNRTSFYTAFRKLMGCHVTDLISQIEEEK